MEKFTITNLKKQLSQKSKEDLVKEIATLCKTFPQVKEYYKAQGSDIWELLAKYKAIIEKEFADQHTRTLPKARFSVARQAINDFKKLTKEPEPTIELMLTYVESVSWFCSEYAPDGEQYYARPEEMFEKALALAQKYKLTEQFQPKAYEIVKNATEGWGHKDSLAVTYGDVYGSDRSVY